MDDEFVLIACCDFCGADLEDQSGNAHFCNDECAEKYAALPKCKSCGIPTALDAEGYCSDSCWMLGQGSTFWSPWFQKMKNNFN